MIVKLTKEEMAEAKSLAEARNKDKVNTKQNSWSNSINSKEDSYLNHLFGLKCEIAVAKTLDVQIDRTIHGAKGDNKMPDLYYKGMGIEIKGRTTVGWDFALSKDDIKLFKSDLGVLCWPGKADDEIEVVGFISREKFSHVAILKNYRYGNRLVAEAKHFTPLSPEAIDEMDETEFVLNPNRGVAKDLSAILTKSFKAVEKENVTHWEKVVQLEQSGLKYKITIERV